MAASLFGGLRSWSVQRDEMGHRTYKAVWLVKTDDKNDGPQTVMNCPGLPAIGAQWVFGNDIDLWAFCMPTMTVSIHKEQEGDPAYYWKVEQTFTTKPPGTKRCQDTNVENPLDEPDRISGGFTKYTREVQFDRFGHFLKTSSHEPLRGNAVEFDFNRPTVVIEQNVADLDLAIFSQMIDRVNDAPLWGVAARCIKLSNASWTREVYGTCNFYYTRRLEFDIKFDTFDRIVPDVGTLALNGEWNTTTGEWDLKDIAPGIPPNANNPSHFSRYKDRNGELSKVFLNGAGLPADSVSHESGTGTGTGSTGSSATISIEHYQEANFLELEIPTEL